MVVFHSVLITGANRGIGLEFVKQFLENPDIQARHVIATSRSLEQIYDLRELQKKHSKLHTLKLDVSDFEAFDNFAAEVGTIVGEKGLTLLINNAGVDGNAFGVPMSSLEEVQAPTFTSILVTNTVAPLMLTKALLPLLRQSAFKNNQYHGDGLSVTRAAVINIGSRSGSIRLAKQTNIRSYGYAESKAALNMVTQSLIIELGEEGILVASIHPGRVETQLTAHRHEMEKISTETSVTGMLKVMLALKDKQKNGFYQYDGTALPL